MLAYGHNGPLWGKSSHMSDINEDLDEDSGLLGRNTVSLSQLFRVSVTLLSESGSLVLGCLTLGDWCTTIVWNAVNNSLNRTVLQPTRLQSSVTLLREPQISSRPCPKHLPSDSLFTLATSNLWHSWFYTFLHSYFFTSLGSTVFLGVYFSHSKRDQVLHHTKQM